MFNVTIISSGSINYFSNFSFKFFVSVEFYLFYPIKKLFEGPQWKQSHTSFLYYPCHRTLYIFFFFILHYNSDFDYRFTWKSYVNFYLWVYFCDDEIWRGQMRSNESWKGKIINFDTPLEINKLKIKPRIEGKTCKYLDENLNQILIEVVTLIVYISPDRWELEV